MSDTRYRPIAFLMYRNERDCTRERPLHRDIDARLDCGEVMEITAIEYVESAYLKISGHCVRHPERVYWLADYEHAE